MPHVESRLLLKRYGHENNHWVSDVRRSDFVLIEIDRTYVGISACKSTPDSGAYWPYRVGHEIRWQPLPEVGD